MSDQATTQELQTLRQENAKLKSALDKRIKGEEKAAARRNRVLKEGGKLLLPLMDRKRVVRSFLQLFETLSRFSGEREEWPDREEIIADSRTFALSSLRFAIRRRMLMFFVSIFAFAVPGIQVYLVFKQNEIIENQNKFFKAEVYDIVARSLTSGDLNSKSLAGALLANTDLDLVSGIVQQVFTDTGVQLGKKVDRSRQLRDAGMRGHIIFSLTNAVEVQGKDYSVSELNALMSSMSARVFKDAESRVPEILKLGETEDAELNEEVLRYLFNLGRLMRKTYSLAVATDTEDTYFKTIGPMLGSASRARGFGVDDGEFAGVFFGAAIPELLIDLALETEFGEPAPTAPSNVNPLLKEGFEKLKTGVGDGYRVSWSTLKKRAEIP